MTEEFMPDWTYIAESDVWGEQVKPWLDIFYQDSLEFRAGMQRAASGDFSSMTIDEFNFWRGWCAALKAVRDTPEEKVETDRLRAKEHQEDETIRQGAGRARAARLAGF